MEDYLNIALIQADLVWENPEQNRLNFTKKIEPISKEVDLIVLPEMFTTGFTMHAGQVAETMTGKTVSWMKTMASKKNCAIMGSIVISESDNFYNRFLFVESSGVTSYYDKRHTFTLVGEHKIYTAGKEKNIIDYKGWKICPLICYDLRFPVWARNTEDYDVLIYVANWPKPRVSAWDALLKARAIENMSYCIGVNRVGVDGVHSEYSGHSGVYDVLGNEMTTFKPGEEHIELVSLEKRHIESYRNKLKFLNDRDVFTLN
ncbi:amidohydrolase [Tamlana sp. 2201CG12-4]|uniref:amidohydrolase n=1 Tax=Tamlana sp. 2201CG12-4 TaxID=3112582 RepID=UPI002DB5AE2B|nr:amidohydrolase [Tamlana sp. 2201CG12-4]MEC3906611.1 amidohydrolase [Tamlana sp. 2201CG12-4]